MHLRGKSFRFEATYPDGRREVLLDVPRYEFDWQNAYILEDPKPMPEGTIVRCVGHFDNSADNPNNPDPTAAVTFGEQTNDEMLIGYMDAALDYQDLSVGPPKVVARADGQFDVTFRHHPPDGTNTVHLAASFNKDYSPVAEARRPRRARDSSPPPWSCPRDNTSTNTCTTATNTAMIPPTGARRAIFNDSVLSVGR